MRISHLCLIGVAAASMSLPGYSMDDNKIWFYNMDDNKIWVYNYAVDTTVKLRADETFVPELTGFVQRTPHDDRGVDEFLCFLGGMRDRICGSDQKCAPSYVEPRLSTFDDLLCNPQQRRNLGTLLMSSGYRFLTTKTAIHQAIGLLSIRLGALLLESQVTATAVDDVAFMRFLLTCSGHRFVEESAPDESLRDGGLFANWLVLGTAIVKRKELEYRQQNPTPLTGGLPTLEWRMEQPPLLLQVVQQMKQQMARQPQPQMPQHVIDNVHRCIQQTNQPRIQQLQRELQELDQLIEQHQRLPLPQQMMQQPQIGQQPQQMMQQPQQMMQQPQIWQQQIMM